MTEEIIQPAPPLQEEIIPAKPKPTESAEFRALAIGVAGWLLPGLGHALQKMWARALIIFLAVGTLVYAGSSMRGNVFTAKAGDAFDTLGYLADLGTGSFYLVAKSLEPKGADVSR